MFNRFRAGFITLVVGFALSSSLAFGGIFDQADGIFAQRENNLAKISEARKAYKQILGTVDGEDRVYEVEQLGKLAFYEGEHLTSLDRNPGRRTEIFADCRDFVESIADMTEARTQYHFWKLQCTAFWVQSAPLLSRLAQIGSIKRYFNSIVGENVEPLASAGIDVRYQGGGIYRVIAGIIKDDLSSLIRSEFPNRAKAIDLADKAIAATAYPGDENAGASYYSNYRGRGDVLNKMGRPAEAKVALTKYIEEIDELIAGNELPVGLEAETKAEQVMMKSILAGIR